MDGLRSAKPADTSGVKGTVMSLGIVNHVNIRVTDIKLAMAFYDPVMEFLGYKKIAKFGFYRLPDRLGDVYLSRVAPKDRGKKIYDPQGPGLAHLAFNAAEREQVDGLHQVLVEIKADILDAPAEYSYSPGYYAVYFTDPDGLKLELAYTPFQIPGLQRELKRIKARERRQRTAKSKKEVGAKKEE